jgi:DNA-directed RNA polymerase
MSETESETWRRSAERVERQNGLVTAKGQKRQFGDTDIGRKMTIDFLAWLSDLFAGNLDVQPDDPPPFLGKIVRELNDPRCLAMTVLTPLLDGIVRGWDRDKDAGRDLKLRIGEDLYRRLYQEPKVKILKPWGVEHRLRAGNWLLGQARRLNVFANDVDGAMCFSDEVDIPQLTRDAIMANPVFAPHLKPPAPWVGWEKVYDDGFRAKFVRDWRPETETAIKAAFHSDLAHAKGVNNIAAAPLKIDAEMLPLVERFAHELTGNDPEQREKDQAIFNDPEERDTREWKAARRRRRKWRADEITIKADVEHAKYCVEHGPTFWNDYSCDRRGRIYALPHLHFGREDHVRSLFRFARGMKLGDDGLRWLKIHAANCEGSTDKMSWDARIEWVDLNRRLVEGVAADPFGTFDIWKEADSQFAFVAACKELAAAWKDPENFVTTLPVAFDGSANGTQHLALLKRDIRAASMVNLLSNEDTGADTPSDVYAFVIEQAMKLLEDDRCDLARWWCGHLKELKPKQRRRLLKQPIMTFGYSVTAYGATEQIAKTYWGFGLNTDPPEGAFYYLAKMVLEACKIELRGPYKVMEYIQGLAEGCTKEKRFLKWTSPSGLPFENRYQKPNVRRIKCISGGKRVEHIIADGVLPDIRKTKVKNAVAPNFIHALDAAHLTKTAIAAASEGIDLLSVHDSYNCLAPQAGRLRQIILDELVNLYDGADLLADLCTQNGLDPAKHPAPPRGTLFESEGWDDPIELPLESVRKAKFAFA